MSRRSRPARQLCHRHMECLPRLDHSRALEFAFDLRMDRETRSVFCSSVGPHTCVTWGGCERGRSQRLGGTLIRPCEGHYPPQPARAKTARIIVSLPSNFFKKKEKPVRLSWVFTYLPNTDWIQQGVENPAWIHIIHVCEKHGQRQPSSLLYYTAAWLHYGREEYSSCENAPVDGEWVTKSWQERWRWSNLHPTTSTPSIHPAFWIMNVPPQVF